MLAALKKVGNPLTWISDGGRQFLSELVLDWPHERSGLAFVLSLVAVRFMAKSRP